MDAASAIGANEDLTKARATITVEDGSRSHSVSLPVDDWKAVVAGRPLCVKGAGYVYEGEYFWDYWDFNSESRGSLLIEYGDAAGAGFDGSLDDATIETHTLD